MMLMDSSQTPRAWIEDNGITAAALDGRPAEEVYAEYDAYTRAHHDFSRPYHVWLSMLPAILPALTLETREESDGRTQTYFATMAVD